MLNKNLINLERLFAHQRQTRCQTTGTNDRMAQNVATELGDSCWKSIVIISAPRPSPEWMALTSPHTSQKVFLWKWTQIKDLF